MISDQKYYLREKKITIETIPTKPPVHYEAPVPKEIIWKCRLCGSKYRQAVGGAAPPAKCFCGGIATPDIARRSMQIRS
jgi:hypothetical protein